MGTEPEPILTKRAIIRGTDIPRKACASQHGKAHGAAGLGNSCPEAQKP